MSKTRLNEDQKDEVVKRYINGESANAISKTLPVSPTAIYGLLKRRNVPRRTYSEASRIYDLNENYFNTIDSQNKAYFLGFLMADGYNNEKRNCVELSCSVKDKETLDMLNKEIGSSKPIRFIDNNGVKAVRIDWCSKKLCKDLSRLGCVQTKTFKLKMPVLRDDLIRHFIRGYFDGDGCISYSYSKKDNALGSIFNGVVTIVGTEDLCYALKKYVKDELDIHTTILCRNPENNNTIRTVQLAGNQQVIKFMDCLYKNANLYMKRKFNKFLSFKNILSNRKCKMDSIKEEQNSLFKLRDIAKTQEDLWKSRYWMTRGIIEHEKRSRFTNDQAQKLRDKLIKHANDEVIPLNKIDEVFELYRKDGFPFFKTSFEDFEKGYESLKKSIITKKSDTYLWDGYGTQYATCFHPQIFNCSRKNKLSAYELFQNDDLFKGAIKKVIALNEKVSDSTIRDICRNDKHSSRINNFPPKVTMSILQEVFNSPISVLDPCAGFSGRLLGCACSALVNRYTGIDLSEKTYEGLIKTKMWINNIDNDTDISIYHGNCLEKMKFFYNYDCILTSPPFLDVERYDGVPYEEDYNTWIMKFIKPFINNCFSCLKPNGRMFLYLEKIGKIDFPNDVSEIAKIIGFKIEDPISFKMSYGENNRNKSSFRGINILFFRK